MSNLKEIRKRIASVKSTKQITQAMKMVAAAKLRKAQQAILQVRPYANSIHELLAELANYDIDSPLFNKREVNKVLIVAISSNRGLCGAFNANVIKHTVTLIEKYTEQGIKPENIYLWGFGKKAIHILEKRGYNVVEKNYEIFDALTFENVKEISETLVDKFSKGEFDKIELVYNSFKNPATQIVVSEQFLPLEKPEAGGDLNSDYIFEPDFYNIIENLAPRALAMHLFKALLDSFASEHGARMTSMHKATDNASELIRQLTLTYNKARQAAITKEILEIVSGAEALRQANS